MKNKLSLLTSQLTPILSSTLLFSLSWRVPFHHSTNPTTTTSYSLMNDIIICIRLYLHFDAMSINYLHPVIFTSSKTTQSPLNLKQTSKVFILMYISVVIFYFWVTFSMEFCMFSVCLLFNNLSSKKAQNFKPSIHLYFFFK